MYKAGEYVQIKWLDQGEQASWYIGQVVKVISSSKGHILVESKDKQTNVFDNNQVRPSTKELFL